MVYTRQNQPVTGEDMPSFFQRLNEHSSKFSPAHKTAAGFFLYHLDEAAFNTLQETADAVGMSTTTIIRFARQLGYEGYSDMQGDIRDILLKKSLPEIPELEDRSLSKTLTETFQVDMQNLELTLKAQKQSDLDQAVRYLAEGKRIYIVGMRTSYALANYAFIRLGQLRRNVQVITNLAGAYPEEIVSATKDDVVLAFAFPRISRLTVAMLNWLRSKQVPVVLITSVTSMQEGITGNVIIPCQVVGASYQNSFVAPLSILNYLSTSLAKVMGKTSPALLKDLSDMAIPSFDWKRDQYP